MARHNRRTVVLLDRKFQLQFSTRLCVILLSSMVLFFALSVMAPAAFGLIAGSVSWGTLQASLHKDVLLYVVALPLLGSFLVLLGQGIRETFRIAGPAGRFKATFMDIRQLRIPRGVRIRRNDYMQDTAQHFSQALVAVQDQLLKLQRLGQVAENALADDASLLSEGRVQVVRCAVFQINEALEEFELVTAAPECAPLDPSCFDGDGFVQPQEAEANQSEQANQGTPGAEAEALQAERGTEGDEVVSDEVLAGDMGKDESPTARG